MDSRGAALPRALRVNANPLMEDLCRNPDSMDGLQFAVHGTGYPLPGGYDAVFWVGWNLAIPVSS